SGNNWVVLGLAVPIPWSSGCFLCLPLAFRLRMPGRGQPGCAALARELLEEVAAWFPRRDIILIGDGGYANKTLLTDLPERVTFLARMRLDAAWDHPTPAANRDGRPGPKARDTPQPAKPQRGSKEGGWQPQRARPLGVASRAGAGLRKDTEVAGCELSGGVAAGAGVHSGPGGGGA